MARPRIGSFCTGYGGLDDAVQNVFGGELAWVADPDPGATAILARHYPGVPNHGDITDVDWSTVEPVDIACMGFPCQDVSVAGLRAGLLAGNRSGLWRHCARAISVLQPSLVVIENVPGLLSQSADGDVEPCPWCLGDGGGEPPLRALGAVLADLAGLGFDAEWTSLAASDVGACHKRNRVFVLAWPADAPGAGLEARREGWSARGVADASDAYGDAVREQPVAVGGGRRSAVAGLAGAGSAADAARDGRHEGRPEPARLEGRSDVAVGGRAAPADTSGLRLQRGGQHGDGGLDLRTAVGLLAAADSDGEPRDERGEPGSGEAQGGGASAVDCGCDRASWGKYAAAVHRWEQVIGRAAPAPVDARGRLAPPFVEWMQGIAEGRVTSVPGLSRAQMLKALGNGVMPQQGTAALGVLRDRMAAALAVAA